jgi:hypothetical protein
MDAKPAVPTPPPHPFQTLTFKLDHPHGLINYKDTKAKSKGTSRQVFVRVYRLEIQSVMLVFSTQLCELLPL